MEDTRQYQELMSEVIAKQIDILGPDIALLKARNVPGVEISDTGKVTNITGDAKHALQQLIDEYVDLSGQIVKTTLQSVFTKYPELGSEIVTDN